MSQRNLLVVLLCIAWLLPGLIGHDPWKPDEAHTFGVVYQLLQGGSWVVPTLAGEPFLDKPPLFHLVAAACAWLFSIVLPLHDAARLSSGLWMALTFGFVAAAARELNDERSGSLAVLLLLGCFGLVVRSHQLITDVAMLAGIAMAYYGCALAVRRPGAGGIWMGSGAGIGFLANGVVAPAIVFAVALLPACVRAGVALPVLRRRARDRRRHRRTLDRDLACAPQPPLSRAVRRLAVGSEPERLHRRPVGRREERAVLPEDIALVRVSRMAARAVGAVADAPTGGVDGAARHPALVGFFVTLVILSASTDARELYALPMLLPLALLAVPGPRTCAAARPTPGTGSA
jgi:4-amino-4-deoxy-L-arabinose transferase-like glycosyltransferase